MENKIRKMTKYCSESLHKKIKPELHQLSNACKQPTPLFLMIRNQVFNANVEQYR